MESGKGKYAAQDRWAQKNAKKYLFKFYYSIDRDIIDKLGSVDSKVEYIRKLIREDLKREKE